MYKIGNKTTNNIVNSDSNKMAHIMGNHFVEQDLKRSISPSGIAIGSPNATGDGVIIDADGVRGYSAEFGETFNLPTDGSAPTFSAGVINQTVFEIDETAVMRTSETVGDGTADSAGVYIDNTGFYACEADQLLADANVQILNDGSASFKGEIEAESGLIGQWQITQNTLTAGTGTGKVGIDSTGEYSFWAGAEYGEDAPFRVTPAGYLTAENVNIGTRQITVESGDDINAAITEVATTGGRVILRNGLYTLDTDILLANTVYLEGETAEGVVLDFVDNTHGIKGIGANAYTTGTVSCTQGTTTVTGDSTSWSTNVAAGQRILLSESWYLITEVVSDTELTIELPYDWATLSGATYVIATTLDDSEVRNMTIINADVGVYLQYTRNCGVAVVTASLCGGALQILDTANLTVSNFQAYGCLNGILLSNTHLTEMVTTGGQGCTNYGLKIANGSANNALSNNFLGGNGTYGLEIENSSNLSISGTVSSNVSHGISITNSNDMTISDSASEGNGGSGIYVSGCTNVALNVAVTNSNVSDGITVVNSTDTIATNGHSTGNGGYGINIDGDSSYTGIIGRGFYSNASGSINDLGTETVISGTLGTENMNLNNILPAQATGAGFYLKTDGADVTWAAVATGTGGGLTEVVEDLTPQLGGDLDVNGKSILAANAAGGSNSAGGNVGIVAGNGDGSGDGGNVQIYGGAGTESGYVYLGGGRPDGSTIRSSITVDGNYEVGEDTLGGDIYITPGCDANGDNDGHVIIGDAWDGNNATLDISSLSTDRTYTFPNKTGTFAMTDDITSGITWSAVTDDANLVVNAGVLANKGTLLTITLPATAAVGDVVRVSGMGAGGWKIAQNAGDIIHIGDTDTTTGASGYISSTHRRDSVELVCVVADNEWNVISSVGNITVV